MHGDEIIFERESSDKLNRRFTFYGGQGIGPDPSFHVDAGFEESVYRVEDDKFTISDAVWGDRIIGNEPGDEVFLELVNHPLIRRLQAIEQLTLPQYMTTIAGTSGFSRWEHVWGSLVLTRKLTDTLDISSEDARKMELRALLSDSAHWAFSHLGDWILQGSGGAEDEHDEHQLELLRKTGVDSLISDFGYDANDLLVKGDHDDWVECSAPDLNVDRVDYGAREMLRWLGSSSLGMSLHSFPFEVGKEGKLVMTDLEAAQQFTRGFLLLSTEHWSEPVHRLQLRLLEEMVKHSIIHYEPSGMRPLTSWRPYHPRDVLMSIDYDFEMGMLTTNPFLWAVRDIADRIGHERRLIFKSMRASYLAEYVRGGVPIEFPDPIRGYGWHANAHSLFPSNVEIIEVDDENDVKDFNANPHTVDFLLPTLKHRYIDPLVSVSGGQAARLSEIDPKIKQDIEAHRQIFNRRYVARIAMNGQFKSMIEKGMSENNELWPQHLGYERMSDAEFREGFEHISSLAVAMRKVHIEWWR